MTRLSLTHSTNTLHIFVHNYLACSNVNKGVSLDVIRLKSSFQEYNNINNNIVRFVATRFSTKAMSPQMNYALEIMDSTYAVYFFQCVK